MVLFEDHRMDYGEQRMVAIGLIQKLIVVVVHVEDDHTIRIISMREATRNETSTTKTSDDMDDYPEFTQDDFDRATYQVSGQPVDKSAWQKAVLAKVKKEKISITLDPDILAYFRAKADGKGYQTLINAALREMMLKEHFKEDLRQIIREELKHA